MTTLPEAITAGVTTGHDAHHLSLHHRYNLENSNDILVDGLVADGATDDTTAITNAISSAPAGSTLRLPPGRIAITPIVSSKPLNVVGSGRFGTTFVCTGNSASPYWSWTFAAYAKGARLAHLGFDLSSSPLGTGIKVGANAEWSAIDHVNILGGALSIDQSGPNGRILWTRVVDAGKFLYVPHSGLELTLEHFIMERLSAGTTTIAMDIYDPSATVKGAVYGHDVRIAVTAGSVLAGMKVTGEAANPLPVYLDKWIFDNISGPAIELIDVQRAQIENGYGNGAAGTSSAVKITGGRELQFMNNQLFGGSGGGGCTYEFTGGSTAFFTSIGNHCYTGPTYKLPASGGPTSMVYDDQNFGGYLSNDMSRLYAATAVSGRGDVRGIGRTDSRAGIATLVGGSIAVANPRANATSSMFNLARRTLSGTPGHLYIASVTTGVGFTIASSTAETSVISWTMDDFI